MTLHAYVPQMTQGLIVLCTTGFLKLMKFKASPVVAKHNVKLVSKSTVIQQRMYLVLIGMLYLIKLVFSIQKRI